MSARTLGLLLVGLVLGPILFGVAGLLGGLTWITLAGASHLDGLSAFVAAGWVVAGLGIGLLAGLGWAVWRIGR